MVISTAHLKTISPSWVERTVSARSVFPRKNETQYFSSMSFNKVKIMFLKNLFFCNFCRVAKIKIKKKFPLCFRFFFSRVTSFLDYSLKKFADLLGLQGESTCISIIRCALMSPRPYFSFSGTSIWRLRWR